MLKIVLNVLMQQIDKLFLVVNVMRMLGIMQEHVNVDNIIYYYIYSQYSIYKHNENEFNYK
jgi:hypothetical protein